MIERFDIILLTETVLRNHAQTRQLLSENGTQDTFLSPKPCAGETTESAETLTLVNNL